MAIRLNLKGLEYETPTGRDQFVEAANQYLAEPDRFAGDPELHAALQHFTVTGDIPTNMQQVLDKFHERADYDMGYEQIFRIHDLSDSDIDHFEIPTFSNTFAFDEIVEGNRIALRRITGAKTQVYVKEFADGLSWSKQTFRFRKALDIQQGLEDMRAAAYQKRATVHYGVIEALPDADGVDVDVAHQTSSADTTIANDALTLQKACEEIDAALADKGMALSQGMEFILLANRSTFWRRMRNALAYLTQTVAGSNTDITYNIRPIFSNLVTSTSYVYIILPQRKIQSGYWQPLILEFGGDTLEQMEYAAGTMMFNCAVAEEDQIRRCATS